MAMVCEPSFVRITCNDIGQNSKFNGKSRAIGLSNSKVSYVLKVARFAAEEGLDFQKLDRMDNEAVIAYLTRIKGVGRRTAEMLLMFGLGREDKKAFREKLLRISAKWSPYRTYACMYLWKYKDNQPVATTQK
jgi:DNA-3-methyladenine glycosylase II